ncbi:hypothetical protein L7F22_050341 [Adiantum nelumboides]|nr:hypothetical protein [Adiantum nelumboides]
MKWRIAHVQLMSVQREMHVGGGAWWICVQNFKNLAEECRKHQLMGYRKRRISCSSRKEVRKLQEACDRLRDAYVAEFEDESSDDDDGWVGLETDIHPVGIPKMEEKEVQKEVGQESLKLPLDTPALPLQCAHGVEMENPLLKLMSVLSLVNEIYYSKEKQIIHIEDVVHKNQKALEEADNVRNGQVDSWMNGKVMDRERNEEEEVIDLFLGSIENVCRITNEESKHEEVSKIECTQEEFGATTMNKSVSKELSPRRSADVNMQLAKLVEIVSQQCTHEFRSENQWVVAQQMQVGSRKDDQVENQQYQQIKGSKVRRSNMRSGNRAGVMLIGNSHTFEEDNCQQIEDGHANADIMAEFCHFKRTSKQMSKEDVETTKQQLQRQESEDDSNITEEIEDDDVHIRIDKASQILEDAECDSDSTSDFNSDSVSILDLDSIANLDVKTNSDANFNGSRGKLDEEESVKRENEALKAENEHLIADLQEMRTNPKEIEESMSKLKAELSRGVWEPDRNLAAEVESNVEKQADPDFLVEKAVKPKAEGDIGEHPT